MFRRLTCRLHQIQQAVSPELAQRGVLWEVLVAEPVQAPMLPPPEKKKAPQMAMEQESQSLQASPPELAEPMLPELCPKVQMLVLQPVRGVALAELRRKLPAFLLAVPWWELVSWREPVASQTRMLSPEPSILPLTSTPEPLFVHRLPRRVRGSPGWPAFQN